MLLVHAGQTVSIDQLVDGIWPDDDAPDRAEQNVPKYVHRLRSMFAQHADRIKTVGAGYRLDLEPDELDATRFERLIDEARAATANGEPERALGLLDQALALWNGRPYDDVADLDWARAEVTRLTELHASAIERRFELLLGEGRHTELVGPLQEAIGDEPWRERRRAQLALALYRAGRQAEALRVIRDYRAELVDELGLDPSAELDELEHRMLDHDPTLLPGDRHRHAVRGYQLDEVIGEGAFSLVWRGTQPTLGRTVAVKQIRAELANQAEFIRGFETEAQTIASLEHPHIVPLYDYWREPDSAFLVMRYVGGGSLESAVLASPLDEDGLRRMVEQVGSALHTAHRAGVLHRDVKSANVLLDGDGNFYLSDFGIAFTGIDDGLAASLSTGSPAYAAPEQLRRQDLDPRSDVYSFGVTLFEAATGRLPFVDAPTQAAMVSRQLHDPIPTPSSVDPSVPSWVDDLVGRATAKNPGDRFATIDDLLAAVPSPASGAPDTAGSAWPTLLGDVVNPFKALRPFRESDAEDFHGRDRLITRFVQVLERPGAGGRMLAAVGPSGSGKSSVVRSGLVPALRRGAVAGSERWFVATMLPGTHPFESLEAALTRVASRQTGPLVEMMRSDARGITRAVGQVLPDEDSELLLVIDQFEELFTLADEATRTAFIDGLLAAVREPRAGLRVVVTIRADFWDRPLRHPQLAARLETAAVTVSPLSPDELEAAIVEPVRRQGVNYEPGLVARIIADVGDQPGALPLLQYALTELFDTQVSGLILAESYEEIGGLAGALATRAEATLTAMSAEQQEAARRMFSRLVTLGEGTEDTRRRVRLAELGDDPDTGAVVAAFGESRMLVFDVDSTTREPTVEISHEALLRAWPRLRAWLDEDRDGLRIHRHLTEAATGWLVSGRDPGELYRGGRLEAAAAWAWDHDDDLNRDERAYLNAGVAAAEAEADAERRRVGRLRRLALATGIVAVLAVVASLVAVGQQRRADDNAADARAATELAETEADRANQAAEQAAEQAARAEDALADAEVATLVSRSAALVDENPSASLLLAVEAYDRNPSNRTVAGLATALGARSREIRRVDLDPIEHLHCEEGHDSHTSYLPFSRDGWVGWHEDGEMSVLDPTTGETRRHTNQPDPCGSVFWGYSDGPVLHEFDGALQVERQPGSGDLTRLIDIGAGGGVLGAMTSSGPDGMIAAHIAGPDGGETMHLFGPDDQPIASPLRLDIEARSLVVSDRLGLAWEFSSNELEGHAIQLVDLASGTPLWIADLPAQLSDVTFGPSDELVAIADRAGGVHMYATADGSPIGTLDPGNGAITSVSFLDDQRLAVATSDGVEVWNVTDGIALDDRITISGATLVRSLGPQRLSVVRNDDELVVLDLGQGGLGRRLAPVPAGARVYLQPEGIAAIATIGAAEGRLVDLVSGESATHPLAVPDAGIVLGISPGDSVDEYLAVTIDGAVGAFEDGELTDVVHVADDPSLTLRFANGHSTPDGESRLAIHLSNEDPRSHEVFLIDLLTYEIVFSVAGECPCAGVTPTPDGHGLVLDTGDTMTVYSPDDGPRRLAAESVDPLGSRIAHAVDPVGDRIMRARPDGVIEVIDMDDGESRVVAEFGVEVSLLQFIDETRAVVVTDSGDVWLIDTEASERIGLVWEGGTADGTSGAPVVSADGDVLWVPTWSEIVEVPLSPDTWRELACDLAGRELTADEWDTLVPGGGEPRRICPVDA